VARAAKKSLDPEGRYGPADLVVSAAPRPPDALGAGVPERIPAREALYRVVSERGPMTLDELARAAPGGAPAPYTDAPELYLLRLVAGARRRLPPLCDIQTAVRILAESPEPDPDYGFEVRPA
jgi:hypothetical protein